MKFVVITIALLIYIISGCSSHITDLDSIDSLSTIPPSTLTRLEYKISGGFFGINYEMIILENGGYTFKHYNDKNYIITGVLSQNKLDSLDYAFSMNHVSKLADNYKSPVIVMDGTKCTINYSSSVVTKNIYAESGADIPKELKNILSKLGEITGYILSNPDYCTLKTQYDNVTEVIKKWPFPEIKLGKKVYMYNELGNSSEILKYFDNIRKTAGYHILFWDGDSLFNIYDGGMDYGYFNIYESFPVKYLKDELNCDLTVLQNNGIILPYSEWKKRGMQVSQSYIYIIDELKDGGNAVRLTLIPGKPVLD